MSRVLYLEVEYNRSMPAITKVTASKFVGFLL